MFLRRKKNKSGSVSIQVLEKVGRKNKLVQTIGSSKDPIEIERLWIEGKGFITNSTGQTQLQLKSEDVDQWFTDVFANILQVKLSGPELVLGKIFDQIGFNQISDELFRHLVLSRIVSPVSKLKTVREIERFYGIHYSVDQVYRYLDKLDLQIQDKIQNISYQHTLKILGGEISIIFYDVTTIYFEAEKEDDLRITGFSKDGKHQHPQIILGLLVSVDGYPLAYNIYPGNTYEGNTFIPVLEGFKKRFQLDNLVVVADAGLLTNTNIEELRSKLYKFIIGARIKSESKVVKEQILTHSFKQHQILEIQKDKEIRLIVQYSERRAKKDAFNRQRGLKRLEKALSKGKLNKSHINNKGYNKYLTMTGDIEMTINYDKYDQDSKWDGLKGYITNTNLKSNEIIKNYGELWKIEKAFRISKTDLKVRPIYHRIEKRIQAHLCISFAAYKVYKELERILYASQSEITISYAIELIRSLQSMVIKHPKQNILKSSFLKPTEDHKKLLKIIGKLPG